MTEIPKSPVKRLMKRAGAERVADAAVEDMVLKVERLIDDVADDADAQARHADRKTVLVEDVELAWSSNVE